ncbi:GNAT family N-acetyltransferase [Clostridium folliculivorans]|uniref:N-acetyltransferase n=1 Tax=Clostridium folliculivorans TaxID=2886038 RepID=A0A9W6DAF6_9CLOT|nr:GNAT family N-acetyltransferase [Clostridium folliculivorans]GKU24916.1 N-acetyltransferase [Clostridium folliculivorans]GKU31014.1 N-acetyltransferase [Clostridium folliculivorans]
MIEIKRGILTAEVFIELVEAVGWGHPSVEQVDLAIKNSLYNVCVMEENKIIAMGRLFGDSSMSYFIKDLVVSPNNQGRGIGKLIIEDMLDFIKCKTPKGWKVCIELMSAYGKEGFYEKSGFEKRPNLNCGSGMSLFIHN